MTVYKVIDHSYDVVVSAGKWWTTTPEDNPEYIVQTQLNREVARFSNRGPVFNASFVRWVKN